MMASELLRVFNSREALKNLLIVALVYGFQAVIHKDLFRCPCENAKWYGVAFLVVPAIFLLSISVVVCQRTWSVVITCLRKNDYKTKCNYFLSSLNDFFKPFLASATWFTIVLLRGDCYVCIRGGAEQGCVLGEGKVNPVNFDQFRAQSFILGSAFLVSMVIFSTGIVFIQRCCTSDVRHLPTLHDLLQFKKQAVEKAFDEKTKEVAREFAERLVECSFSARDYSECDVDQQFFVAREKVMDIYGHKVVNGCVVDCCVNNMQSMEFTCTTST